MPRDRDEYLGCASCRTVLYRLPAVKQDNAGGGFFIWGERVALMDHTPHKDPHKCPCGEPLVRMHKASWE